MEMEIEMDNFSKIFDAFKTVNFKGLSIKEICDKTSLERKVIFNIINGNSDSHKFIYNDHQYFLKTEYR